MNNVLCRDVVSKGCVVGVQCVIFLAGIFWELLGPKKPRHQKTPLQARHDVEKKKGTAWWYISGSFSSAFCHSLSSHHPGKRKKE